MISQLIKQAQSAFHESLEFFKEDMRKVRTSRASSSLVEDITFDYYGSSTRIKEAATITIGAPNLIIIQPWDKTALEGISRSIGSSGLELSPVIDGEIIRISIPLLTEERRHELSKFVKEKAERVRIGIRNKREEIMKAIRSLEEGGGISEDEIFRAREELQRLVDNANANIKKAEEEKEKELMTI